MRMAGVSAARGGFTNTRSMFQRMRCAMTLGCMLPNRLLTGSLIVGIGSQMNQPCSFMMFWISFHARLLHLHGPGVVSISSRARSMRASSGVAGFCCRTNQKCDSPDDRQTFWPPNGVGGTLLCNPSRIASY